MSVIAVTGELAAGKSTLLEYLARQGAAVFDVDQRIHQYYRDPRCRIYKKIARCFPGVVRGVSLSRKKLAVVVFSDPRKLAALERIIHPVIIRELRAWVKTCRGRKGIFVAEVPLLFEKRLERLFDLVIVVTVRRSVLIGRIVKKYRLSRAQAMRRLALYVSLEQKKKRADFILDNSAGMRSMQKEVDLLWKKLN